MSTYTYGKSLWMQTAQSPPEFPALKKDAHTDVVIIGGGLTGLHTGIALAEAGKKVIIVEKRKLATAASAGPVAKVTASHAYLHSGIRSAYGDQAVRVYGQMNDAGYRRIQDLIKTYAIECDFDHNINLAEGTKPTRRPRLQKEFDALKVAGLDVRWTEGADTGDSVFPNVSISIKNPGQARYHPRKFALGLVDAFINLGGQIYEDTEVTQVTEDVKTAVCTVKTSAGNTLTSDYAVVATRVPDLLSKRFRSSYGRWGAAIYAYKVDAVKYPDTYYRLSRTITSYRPHTDKATGINYVLLEGIAPGTFRRRLGFEGEPAAAWYCRDTDTKDYLPTIGRWCNTRKHLYCALGYNGWGMTNSAAAGLLLAQEIAGDTRFAKALGDEELTRAAVKLLTPLNKERDFNDKSDPE